jgi:protein arginine kinase activator
MKCDHCNNPATVHLIEIINGKKVEKHLCEQHASEAGVGMKIAAGPINSLLEKFVMKNTGLELPAAPLRCEHCGVSYEEFRKSGLLGCPECYKAFEAPLTPLLQRAHEGATSHLGKIPPGAGASAHRQHRLRQLQRELEQAIASEQYELAARLRDQVRQAEERPT